ncbi:MAG: YcjX family protein, partial [Hyphomicrobiaceae bacterium]
QLRVTFEYESDGLWNSAVEALMGRHVLHLDIIDYPGEWLLDLPLLTTSFEDWSREAMRLAQEPLRSKHAAAWLDFAETLDPAAAQDEAAAAKGAELFRSYLAACRDASQVLSTVPPGRFLLPGDLAGSPALTFMPLELGDAADALAGSLHAMMARRYEAYKTTVIKPFYRDHFARLDRQIVLVDALAALNAGPAAVADLERALEAVLASFKTGANSWLSAILGKRIDKLMFAATKADHLHEASHDRLKAILGALTEKARGQADFAGAETTIEAIASVRATRQGTAKQNDEELPCIVGTPMPGEVIGDTRFHGNREAAIFPGDLPGDPVAALKGCMPEATDTAFVRFRPPVGDDARAPLPHIRLDRVLQFLLGDRLT